MATITVEFFGICTHLIATHKHPKVPEFTLTAGDGSTVLHRVVLPNSDLIGTHIDRNHPVPPHIPKLIVRDQISSDLAEIMTKHETKDGPFYDMPLKELTIGFENVDVALGDYWKELEKIPHIWDLSPGHPELRKSIKYGWSDHASAYIDFTTGVTFHVKQDDRANNVNATVTFQKDAPAAISIRHRNGSAKEIYELSDGTTLTVSDVPIVNCCNWDYLLNYFVTTLDVCESPPVWPGLPFKEGTDVNATDYAGTEVYCSSSGYP